MTPNKLTSRSHTIQNQSNNIFKQSNNNHRVSKNEDHLLIDEEITDFLPQDLKLLQENAKLKRKIKNLKNLLLSDKTHKALKKEASEIFEVLQSLVEAVYQQHGVILKSAFSQE